MIKMKLGVLLAKKQTRSGARTGRSLTIEEFLERMERLAGSLIVRNRCKAEKLIAMTRGKMVRLKYQPVSNESLLFDRISDWVDRKGWLPGSYVYMLKMLRQGKRYEEIIPSCDALF